MSRCIVQKMPYVSILYMVILLPCLLSFYIRLVSAVFSSNLIAVSNVNFEFLTTVCF